MFEEVDTRSRERRKWQNILITKQEIDWKDIFSNIYSSTYEK